MAKTESCCTCVYAYWDISLWARTLWSGFPFGPMCANHPDTLGLMRENRGRRVCRNYREKPPEPDAQAKRITLTNGMIAYVDAADYEELSRYTWQLVSGGYAGRHENRKLIFMHRQIMNPPKGMQVDHLKGNRLDNTRARLGICTLSENAQNRAKRANATSRYRGVSYSKDREEWVVALPREANQKFVGSYDDEVEAARAYDYAAVLYLDDSARLNFPEEWPPERKAQVRATRPAERGQREGAKGRPPRARRKTHGAKRATKSKRATGHNSRPTARKGPQRKTRGAKRATKPRRRQPDK